MEIGSAGLDRKLFKAILEIYQHTEVLQILFIEIRPSILYDRCLIKVTLYRCFIDHVKFFPSMKNLAVSFVVIMSSFWWSS